MRRLIVNADDFGLTRGINRAVMELHGLHGRDSGILTSATLMAASPRFAEAVALAKERPSLGVGCHIVLVDGTPVADSDSIPSLLGTSGDSRGRFRASLGSFVRELMLGRITRIDIQREAIAQISRLQRAGIVVTHVDTHKHTHMFPAVLDAVTRAASACGVGAIRNPFEPAWSVAATANAGATRRFQVRILSGFRGHFLRLVRERGFATSDGCLGVTATGTLDGVTLRTVLGAMPDGTWELVCHPAYVDDELRGTRTRLQESRAVELPALRLLPEMLGEDVQRIHFGDL